MIPEAAVEAAPAPFIASCEMLEDDDQIEFDTFKEAEEVSGECCAILRWNGFRYMTWRAGV